MLIAPSKNSSQFTKWVAIFASKKKIIFKNVLYPKKYLMNTAAENAHFDLVLLWCTLLRINVSMFDSFLIIQARYFRNLCRMKKIKLCYISHQSVGRIVNLLSKILEKKLYSNLFNADPIFSSSFSILVEGNFI